ncbi:MAG: single-stranded-DNA-specific exonuclease RecJ [Crocinitomicaceae bacterium]|nr:single-stranded-DNA-specific exonuclease RecJ [Crocinitomicaceae bacterium]
MQKRWFVRTPQDSTTVEEFRSELKVDAVVAELLLQRGIDSYQKAEAFFRPKLEHLHDPFLMKDMDVAVDRLLAAIASQEKVMLYGDYDVDGTTAVALLYQTLRGHLENLEFYIPDRYSEGYGVSSAGIAYAKEQKIELIITLDCGIKALDRIAEARTAGIDVIVCDHHRPGSELPNAIVLDPKRSDCAYPFDELCGCGVGFKLMQALFQKQDWSMEPLWNQLDLLALSIGADLVPVTGENRALAMLGLERLNTSPRTAFKEMLVLANRTFPVTLTDVVFTIAPRINAAGRLRSGKYAVQLMVSDDTEEIQQLAEEINEDNLERRELDKGITEEALKMLETYPKERCTNVVFKSDWHKGVVGIVASRIIEKSYKPTIVLTKSNGEITGSARSVQGFDVHAAIDQCSDLLEKFGGHKYAAGLTMSEDNVHEFMTKFEAVVKESIDPKLLIPEEKIDLELSFDQIFRKEENRLKIPKIKRILRQFEPHGPENMKPVFVSKNVFSTDLRVLKEAHLKLSVTQPETDVVVEAIGFNLSDKEEDVASGIPFDVAYTLEINRWRDRETLQLNVKDIRPHV